MSRAVSTALFDGPGNSLLAHSLVELGEKRRVDWSRADLRFTDIGRDSIFARRPVRSSSNQLYPLRGFRPSSATTIPAHAH